MGATQGALEIVLRVARLMPSLALENCVVIVLRPEESKPTVLFPSGSELDAQRSIDWLARQPALLELVVRALRLAGDVDDSWTA